MTHANTNRKAPNAPSKVQGAFQNTNTVNSLTAEQKNKAIANQISDILFEIGGEVI